MKKIILSLTLLLLSCTEDTKEKLVVYQSPTCGCCSGWVANMESNGMNVEAIKTNDMYTTKVNAGIDMSLSSCHTGFIGGYFIEGLSNDEIIELKDKDLQSIGISYRKATYIRNVFIFFKDCKFDFAGAPNHEVINELTTIKGIGAWSSEMFLMFVLMRINIFSKGDLALMNSIKINYKIDIKDQSKVNSLVESWSPYKSVASLLLWKSIEEKYFFS